MDNFNSFKCRLPNATCVLISPKSFNVRKRLNSYLVHSFTIKTKNLNSHQQSNRITNFLFDNLDH